MTRFGWVLLLALSCATWEESPAQGSLICNEADSAFFNVDTWRIEMPDNDEIVIIEVDTVNAITAFDPAFSVFSVTGWSNEPSELELAALVAEADDNFACTFPPPEFECPGTSVIGRGEDVAVFVGNASECALSTQGDYEISATTAGGAPVRVQFLGVGQLPNPDAG